MKEDSGSMLQPVSYFSPNLDLAWLEREMEEQALKHPNFVCTRALSFSWLPMLYRVSGWLGIGYPLWRYTARFRFLLNFVGVKL